MNDLPSKYAKLIDRLFERTNVRAQEWVINPQGELETSSRGYQIRLKNYRDGEGEPFEAVEIYNSSDELIESFHDGTISKIKPTEGEFPNYYLKMEKLRQRARRSALGADDALKDILSDLDDDVPF